MAATADTTNVRFQGDTDGLITPPSPGPLGGHAGQTEAPSVLRRRFRLLALALTLVIALTPLSGQTAGAAVGDCVPSSSWGTPDTSLAAQVVQLVNDHRTAMGLGALSVASTLTASAEWKSLHMAGTNYFAHDDQAPPVARTVAQRLDACGYPSGSAGWGENIAYGYTTAAAVMDAWLNSSGHRANIENPSFKTIGVGVARNGSGPRYWTQNFGTTGASSSPPPSPPPADTEAPTVPAGVAVSATQTSLSVSWQASTDNVGVVGYGVYVNGSLVSSPSGTSTTISSLNCGATFAIAVDAVDAAGNRSAKSTVNAFTSACPTAPPASPPGPPPPPPPPPPGSSPPASSPPASSPPAASSPTTPSSGSSGSGSSGSSTPVATAPSQVSSAASSAPVQAPAPVASPTSSHSSSLSSSVLDVKAPTAPLGVHLVGRTPTSVSIRWRPAFDNVAVRRYRIYRNGHALKTVKQTAATLTGLSCGKRYTIAVSAIDAARNESRLARLWVSRAPCALE
jgi:uncharacterized protein YkwD